MIRLGFGRISALTVIVLAAAGCGTDGGPPPVTSLDARICSPHPDLAALVGARPLSLDTDIEQNLEADSPCLLIDGVKRVYAAFRLPDSSESYIVSVTSMPVGTVLFSPHLQMLDRNGAVRRELPRESFLFHGPSLYGALRSRSDEYFLLVTSDPPTAGSSVSRLAGSTQQTMATTGTVFFMIHTGSEATTTYTYAHNGRVKVGVHPVPKAN